MRLALRLHSKFLLLVLGSLVLFLGILAFVMVSLQRNLLEQKALQKQNLVASIIYNHLKSDMLQGMPRSTVALMNRLRGRYGLVRLETVKPDGSPAFGTRGEHLGSPALPRVLETGEELSYREPDDYLLHTVLYPLRNEKTCAGCHRAQGPILGVLLVTLTLEDDFEEIAVNTRRLSLVLLGLIVLIGTVLYWLIRRLVLRPLAVLHAGAERIGRGEFAHRVSLLTGDEMQMLATTMNEMAARLDESYAGLENIVRERTAEAEEKARRLYEYSRDMAAISRLSTRVFNAEQTLDEMLDRFIRAVSRGLGYRESLLYLVNRKQAALELKRDSGLGSRLIVGNKALSAPDPFMELVRTGKSYFVRDNIASDPVFGRYWNDTAGTKMSLHVAAILSGTHSKHCWEAKGCDKTSCPAYRQHDLQCWLAANTLCGNTLIESYGDKLAYCMTCSVFPVQGVLLVGAPAAQHHRLKVKALSILTAEMGAALENHQLYEYNRQLVGQLIELDSATASSLARLSLDKALEAFTASALKFPGLDACSFWLLSPEGDRLVRKAGGYQGPDDGKDFCPEGVPVAAGVLARAFRKNIVIAEYHAVYDDPTPLGAAAARHGFPSLLAVPLRTESRSIGVFSVHKKSSAPFAEMDIATFMLLANHAAMAISVCLLNEELKSQNRELARSTSLMGGMLASMSSGVMLLGTDGTVRLVNQTGASLLLMKDREMMNRRITNIMPDAALFLKWPPVSYDEIEIRRGDGSVIPLGYSTADYFGESRTREGTIVVFRDLTEIRALQAEVLNKERFAAMGQVVAGVAHEIRNPLFGISSIGQIFERELKEASHVELARALLSETKRLNQLVEELLLYGRPIKLSLARCDLLALWEEVVDMHREELARNGIAVKGDLSPGQVAAYVDVHQIRQVFLNLLRNSIDAMSSGGTISLRLLMEDKFIIVHIDDTGPGIPKKELDKVFDLFYTTKPKGSGLGLAICRKIIEDHGGVISIERRSAETAGARTGTSVTVKLPYHGEQAKK